MSLQFSEILTASSFSEEEDGYTFISAKRDFKSTVNLPERNKDELHCFVHTTGPNISSLSTLRSIIGPVNFASIVLCLLVGRQIIVRGQPAVLIASILFSLKVSVPVYQL